MLLHASGDQPKLLDLKEDAALLLAVTGICATQMDPDTAEETRRIGFGVDYHANGAFPENISSSNIPALELALDGIPPSTNCSDSYLGPWLLFS